MKALADLVAEGLVAEDWAEALAPVEEDLIRVGAYLRTEVTAGRDYLPRANQVLRAFQRPLSEVKVLLVGQDPYPTPGHPVGLSFSVAPDVTPVPASLRNIFTELVSDLGCRPPATGDLHPWSEAGVMLLNRTLTVRPGLPNSHRGRGWAPITDQAIRALAGRGGPMAAILWGRDAQTLIPELGEIPWVASPHPSPLSAHRGFFGSRPFSRTNELLAAQGGAPVDWALPHEFHEPTGLLES